MSEKLTRIRLPNGGAFKGLQDWGEKSASDMIKTARAFAERLRAEAEAIEQAADHEFQVDVVRGPYVQHHVKELQRSSLPAPSKPNQIEATR